MEPFARLMEGAKLPGVLATRDARPRGALVHASLAAGPHLADKRGRHLTGTFCLTVVSIILNKSGFDNVNIVHTVDNIMNIVGESRIRSLLSTE
ncbi:unnamed protein product [Leptidea sinapis]|uniref:Uncharacterized protein n=1 Tax=Leptidea sinapis TaxID=189913 RepID=A0A5E4PNF1_9NEOP|nr:unnamed protein product [Leptidea sinapis]